MVMRTEWLVAAPPVEAGFAGGERGVSLENEDPAPWSVKRTVSWWVAGREVPESEGAGLFVSGMV